jgi:hypothetical protein
MIYARVNLMVQLAVLPKLATVTIA